MTTEKRRGRPKGSKNKPQEKKIEAIVIEEQSPIVKKRGRPSGSKNKAVNVISVQETQGSIDLKLVWGHLNTGFANYHNTKNNLELHKEDIPIFATDYRKRFKKNPIYTVINARNQHLIPYIQTEFPDIGVGYLGGVALWELWFCWN